MGKHQLDLFGLESVTRAPDHEIISGLRRLHGSGGRWLDATAGKRIMWRGSIWRPSVFLDVNEERAPAVCGSYYAMPFASDVFGGVVFDPPHLPANYSAGANGFRERYGLEAGTADMGHVLIELARVLKPGGLLLVKLCDYVQSCRYVFALVDAVNALRAAGFRCRDLVVKVRRIGPVSGSWKTQQHTRRAHSWWIAATNHGGAS